MHHFLSTHTISRLVHFPDLGAGWGLARAGLTTKEWGGGVCLKAMQIHTHATGSGSFPSSLWSVASHSPHFQGHAASGQRQDQFLKVSSLDGSSAERVGELTDHSQLTCTDNLFLRGYELEHTGIGNTIPVGIQKVGPLSSSSYFSPLLSTHT